jgi:molybdopterin-guanine dinucleotide biosynthesis protein A
VGEELLVTTNRPDDYSFLMLPLLPDRMPGLGAVGGLYTALSAAHGPVVAVVACDMPFVQPDLLLAQRDLLIKEMVDVVIPCSPEGLEPLHAVYRRESCLAAVEEALRAGERKMISWLGKVRARTMSPQEVAVIDPDYRSFINVNRPEEFAAAEALARALET